MKELDQLMRNVHFSKRYQGYRYLRRCIMLAAEDEERLTMLVKGIYWQVAEEYHQVLLMKQRKDGCKILKKHFRGMK